MRMWHSTRFEGAFRKDLQGGVSSSLNSCNMAGLILSGSAAFSGLRCFRCFNIPGSEMLISGITGVGFLSS